MTGKEEMTPTHLVGILKHTRFWSSWEVVERCGGIWGRGRSKRKGEGGSLTSSLTAAPHSRKLTLRKNGSIYLPFPSIYLLNSIHQYLSFPKGFRHVQQFILLNYISIRGWREARLQMLTLTYAQCCLDTASTHLLGAPTQAAIPSNTTWHQIILTTFSLEWAVCNTC